MILFCSVFGIKFGAVYYHAGPALEQGVIGPPSCPPGRGGAPCVAHPPSSKVQTKNKSIGYRNRGENAWGGRKRIQQNLTKLSVLIHLVPRPASFLKKLLDFLVFGAAAAGTSEVY